MNDVITDAIEKTIEINAPIERVWRALTTPEEFGAWFRVKFETPFIVGEEARGQITHPGYEHVTWRAVIKAMEAPDYFAMTWHPYAIDPTVDYSGEEPTLIEFRLMQTDSGTRLTVRESGFAKIPANRRDEALRMNESGWEIQVQNIKTYVER